MVEKNNWHQHDHYDQRADKRSRSISPNHEKYCVALAKAPKVLAVRFVSRVQLLVQTPSPPYYALVWYDISSDLMVLDALDEVTQVLDLPYTKGLVHTKTEGPHKDQLRGGESSRRVADKAHETGLSTCSIQHLISRSELDVVCTRGDLWNKHLNIFQLRRLRR
ncbi:hypothetical protein RND71_025017 [Anisodus tanguticus]|uniref:Uncharacterized protein n=1 Tax=Anisodus tanguticus TaxID=243964 RepID=A0AAE1RS53_9SOLA|nr:hypothetical protein RND71_025017 [Anisodus tanguticus]